MSDKISKHFTWREALWLPRWEREANISDGLNDEIRFNLEYLFKRLDIIRDLFNVPVIVHCAYRPLAYNLLVKGVVNSCHLSGSAVDFHVDGVDCAEARLTIIGHNLLSSLKLRMEDRRGDWVHIDTRDPGLNKRFFKP